MNYIILIPIYKLTLSETEQISLSRITQLFPKNQIKCIGPLHFRPGYIEDLDMEFFSAKYFISTQSYNDLLVSGSFYKRFIAYDYLLIYQLDAYIFKNELDYWCNKGYSYIGAPWIYAPYFEQKSEEYHRMGLIYPSVGNGGLSLRATRIHYLSCLFFGTYWLRKIFKSYNEDWFWCTVIAKINPWYKLAPLHEAKYFSIEYNPAQAVADLQGSLPFGCHAWDKFYEDFWYRYIGNEYKV